MTNPAMNSVLDDLMAQRTWVESLCTSLVRDKADAQDLAQETMLSGLLRKTPLLRPRAWLRRVAENHARQQHRSRSRTAAREREIAAANSDATTCPVEVNAAFEVQRQVAAAVDGLPEPFRTTVLLHHFEGLTLAAIAKQQQQPEGTVRWRLFRAHELLRERLHKVYGEDWRTAILPLCATGVRTTGAALLFAAVLLLAVGGAFWFGSDRAATAVEAAQAEPARVADRGASPSETVAADLARTNASAPAANVAPGAAAVPATVEPQSAIVRARIVDEVGVPIDGAVLRFERMRHGGFDLSSPLQSLLIPDARAATDGVASLRLRTDDRLLGELPASMRPARGEPWQLSFSASAKGYLPAMRETFVADGDDQDLGEVRLQRAASLRGKVRTRDGSGIASARVGVFGSPLPLRYEAGGAGKFDLDSAIATAETAVLFSRGSYELERAPRGPAMIVAVADGYRSGARFVDITGDEQEVEDLVLEPLAAAELALPLVVKVVDDQGEPVGGALVHRRQEHVSASGTAGPDGIVRFGVTTRDGMPDRSPATVVANDPSGRLQSAIRTDVVPAGEAITIELGTVRAVEVVVRSPGSAMGDLRADWTAEDPVVANLWIATDGDRVRFAPPPFAARLRLVRDHCVPFVSQPYEPGAWPERLEVVLQAQTALSGSVTAGGAPVDGAMVLALTRGSQVLRSGYRTGEWTSTGSAHAVSDARGEFSVARETKGEVRLLVQKDGFAPAVSDAVLFDPGTSLRVPPMELRAGGSIRGRLRTAAGVPVARAVVAINHELFGPRTVLTGRDGSFAFEHVAAGGYEVRPGEQLMDGGWSESPLGDGVQQPFAVDAVVAEGQVSEVDLVADACRLGLQIAGSSPRALSGWTVELRAAVDNRAVFVARPLPQDGKVEFAVARAGDYEVVLRSPGGPFGDVRAVQQVALVTGQNELALALVLAPWNGALPGLGDAGTVSLVQHENGLRIESFAKVDRRSGVAACPLVPVGEVEVWCGGDMVARVDTRTVR